MPISKGGSPVAAQARRAATHEWRCWRDFPGATAGDEVMVAHGVVGDCEFENPKEQHSPAARTPTIEAEHELVEVAGQVCVVRRPLMGAEQPPLGQRDDLVNGGK